jgi:hypothetical protein
MGYDISIAAQAKKMRYPASAYRLVEVLSFLLVPPSLGNSLLDRYVRQFRVTVHCFKQIESRTKSCSDHLKLLTGKILVLTLRIRFLASNSSLPDPVAE